MNTPPVPAAHAAQAPSDWVRRWAHLVPAGGRVLDVACGTGRHAHFLASRAMVVTAVDRDPAALVQVRAQWPTNASPPAHILQADLESEPWPLPGSQFDAVVVTHYLWRPLWPSLLGALAPGGMYIHETFAHGNATVGKPSRPDFLLQPGELLTACQGLRVVAFEDGFCEKPDRYLQRIVAVKEQTGGNTATPPRYPLRALGG